MRTRVMSVLICALLAYMAGCGGGGNGYIPPPAMSPANGAVGVPVTTNLSWTAMSGALSYDVYLGTDETLVTNATTADAEFKGNQVSLIYDPPGNLNYDTQYYWRIDKVDAGGPTAGTVWTFTTESAPVAAPGKASVPDPANGAANVPIDKVLGWNAATGAVSYDVYFGTDQTAVTNATTADTEWKGNQDSASYDPPGNMNFLMTYYWRIDSVNGIGTTKGDVWQFTTASVPALPPVSHSGTILANETWDAAHLHIVDGNVYVEGAGSVTLTIEAGAFVVFNAGCFLHVGYNDPGGLRAVGDAVNRITFTANSPAPTKGFWGAIYFHDQAYDYDANPGTGCVLDYCDVLWAGHGSGWGRGSGAILVEGTTGGPSIKISNSNISNSGAFGILISEGGMFASGSSSNTITTCNSYPVGIDANEAGTLEAGTYTGNTNDAVELETWAPVDASAAWINPGVPYVIPTYDLQIEGAGSPVLTLTAGSELRFGSGVALDVGFNDTGGLVAVGTGAERITFTANSPSPTKGFWVGIYFDELALPSSELDYCDVEYAGGDCGWGEGDGCVLVEGDGTAGTSVKISNCNIANSAAFGILLGWGGSFAAGSTGNTVSDCNSYPVGIDAHMAHTLGAGTYTGNTTDSIRIEPWYEVNTTCTWINPGVPYEITGISNLRVEGGGNPTLTIASGSTLVFDSQLALDVGYNYAGGLSASGVTFTGKVASNSYWEGINFYDLTITSTLDNCTIECGGYNGDIYDGNIIIHDTAGTAAIVTITNCTIQNTNGWGIVRYWDSGTYGNKSFTATNTFNSCVRGSQSAPW